MAQAELLEQHHRHAPRGQGTRGGRPEQAGSDHRHLDPFHGRDDSRPAGGSSTKINNQGATADQALAEAEP